MNGQDDMNEAISKGITDDFWKALFDADSVAVIGANNTPGSWGQGALRTVLAARNHGRERQIYAVNPNLDKVMGMNAFDTVLDIPGPVDLAFIIVRADIVPQVMKQCVEKKIKAGVIISAGFAEIGEEGAKLQDETVSTARQGGLHFVGPNCVGHADVHTRVASAMVSIRSKPGSLGLISQSGTLGSSIAGIASNRGIGISKFVSTGNEADLRMEDYLEYIAQDEKTRVIATYIEGLREARRFFQLAQGITVNKPILAIKTGSTGEAGKAAHSHTGAMAGADEIYSAAFKQSGVIRADDEEELCDVAVGLISQPLPRGNGVGILTMGGGFGVVTAEACEKEGLVISPLEEKTIEKLNGLLPPRWSHANPVDLVGMKMGAGDETAFSCLIALMEDKNVDIVLSLMPPMSIPFDISGTFTPEQIRAIRVDYRRNMRRHADLSKKYGKPLCLVSRFSSMPMAGEEHEPIPIDEKIPEYSHPRHAARVLKHLVWYRNYLDSVKG